MASLPWHELLELQVVKNLAQLIQRRWHLGVGYASADGSVVRPPRHTVQAHRVLCPVIQSYPPGETGCEMTARTIARLFAEQKLLDEPLSYTCHAGFQEIAAPIVVDGVFSGALLVGGFVVQDEAEAALLEVDRRTAGYGTRGGDYTAAREGHPRLTRPEIGFLTDLVELCAAQIVEVRTPRRAPQATFRYSYEGIIGRSRAMHDMCTVLDKVIDSDSTVLIQGENGTGKELIAKAIHYNSARADRRFVIQNCSAFNDNLLDSELFGHKRGAFTGAIADKQGLFEVADGGTFFLDEIGDMSAALQVKLLRVLQEGTFTPVGDTSSRKVDVRIIAATNRDLKKMVERGEFREDLYYRVNVINLVMPPLRERKDDIPLLVEHFLRKHGRGRRGAKRLSKACEARLYAYHWPGNVRELENEIERAVVLAGDEKLIEEGLLSPRVRQAAAEASEDYGLPGALAQLERTMIEEALRRHHGNKTRAATDLRVSRRNLIRLVQKYGLDGKTTDGKP
jgi:two-component system, NtrC family, response regulator HupR/HoxA